jgi:hypothetical protein
MVLGLLVKKLVSRGVSTRSDTIEKGADSGVPHKITISKQEQAAYNPTNQEELRYTGNPPVACPVLEKKHQGEVSEVHPIGGVGEIPHPIAFAGEKMAE